jgi:outer membrane lipoprotein carrier protein
MVAWVLRVRPFFLVSFAAVALIILPGAGLFAAVTAPVHTQAPLPTVLKQIEERYAHALTLTATFHETTQSAAFKTTKKSSGVISFKRPGKVRWETLEPDKNLLVGDGAHFWYYTPPFDAGDSGQYSERPASKVQSKFAQVLLSASFSSSAALRSMKVEAVGATQFKLTPQKGTAGTVRQALITVDVAHQWISAVQLTHSDGNQTQILLSNIELGKALDDKLFSFTPPPHTDKIEE